MTGGILDALNRFFHDLLCRIGLHAWVHVFGSFNHYFECRCGAREVRLGFGGYQPVASWWLRREANPEPTPPQGGSGIERVLEKGRTQ